MADTPAVLEMRSRIRRHMLTSIGGVVAGFALMAIGAALAGPVPKGQPVGWPTVVMVLAGIAAIPAIGFYSTFKNLRCPQCDGLVAWQVSWKFSAFSPMASNECRHCGTTLFSPQASKRFFLVVAVIAVIFFLGGIMASVSMASRPHPQPGAPAPAQPHP